MLWPLVILMALGGVCTNYLDIDAGVLTGVGGTAVLLMYVSYRRNTSITLLLYLNSFIIGLWYGELYSKLVPDNNVTGTVDGKRHVRHHISETVVSIEKVLSESGVSKEHCALLNVMMLGDRSGLDKSQKALFRQGGAQHLLALSGLHIGIFLTLLNLLFLRRVRFHSWRWPVLGITLFLLWYYAIMVGLPKSLLRAMLMTTIFLIGQFLYRPDSGSNVLAMTVFAMLAIDPRCVFDVGAQLSVSALVGLVFFSPSLKIPTRHKIDKYFRSKMRRHFLKNLWLEIARRSAILLRSVVVLFWVSFSASMFTAPLVVYYFHQFQPWQSIVSVVLIPLTSFILYLAVFVVLVCAIGLQSVTFLLSSILDWLMDLQDSVLRFSASLPYSSIVGCDVSLLNVVLLYALLFFLLRVLRSRTITSLSYSAISCAVVLLLLFYF